MTDLILQVFGEDLLVPTLEISHYKRWGAKRRVQLQEAQQKTEGGGSPIGGSGEKGSYTGCLRVKDGERIESFIGK